jgi:hypothetical protein
VAVERTTTPASNNKMLTAISRRERNRFRVMLPGKCATGALKFTNSHHTMERGARQQRSVEPPSGCGSATPGPQRTQELCRATSMIAHSAVAAVSDRRRRSEIDATTYVARYRNTESLRRCLRRKFSGECALTPVWAEAHTGVRGIRVESSSSANETIFPWWEPSQATCNAS